MLIVQGQKRGEGENKWSIPAMQYSTILLWNKKSNINTLLFLNHKSLTFILYVILLEEQHVFLTNPQTQVMFKHTPELDNEDKVWTQMNDKMPQWNHSHFNYERIKSYTMVSSETSLNVAYCLSTVYNDVS